MKKMPASLCHTRLSVGISLLTFAFLAACGDTVENTTINQTGLDVVSSVGDLPKCTGDNEGEQVLVKEDGSVRICFEEEWKSMSLDGTDSDFSCKTEELKDKSGLKIVCNGDSIGVVLNGSDGKDGKQGEAGKDGDAGTGCEITDRNDTAVVVKCGESTMTIDLNIGLPNDTAEADSERTPISLDSLVGFTQKGPFLKGSTVYLYELSDGRTLKQTNGNFTSNISQDNGRYKFLARDLVSQYAMIVVDGYYRNEVTGVSSNAPIRLKAITDMRKRSSVNVNILTHLEFERVYHLVTRGDSTGKKLTVKQAKRRAQKEILKIFNIELDENTDAEDMDVFGKSAADAALLAISILLQGDRTESEMMALLSEISNDIAEDGKWNDTAAREAIADWAFGQDLSRFRKNVEGWGLGAPGDSVADFESLIENFIAKTFGIEVCGTENDETKQTVQNPKSKFFGKEYRCYRAPDWRRVTWADKRPMSQYLNQEGNYVYNYELEIDELVPFDYGEMMDWRDRRMYYTIEIEELKDNNHGYPIGVKKLWLAENLDFDYRVNGLPYGSSCYRNDCSSDSSKLFGRYYTWGAAMDSAGVFSNDAVGCGEGTTCYASDKVQGVCPEGWHLPTLSEWRSLIKYVEEWIGGGEEIEKRENFWRYNNAGNLLSSRNWEGYEITGVDTVGFSAVPAGWCGRPTSSATSFWSSTELDGANAFFAEIGVGKTNSAAIYDWPKMGGGSLSIRCLKD